LNSNEKIKTALAIIFFATSAAVSAAGFDRSKYWHLQLWYQTIMSEDMNHREE
jgi:hypothetical protein